MKLWSPSLSIVALFLLATVSSTARAGDNGLMCESELMSLTEEACNRLSEADPEPFDVRVEVDLNMIRRPAYSCEMHNALSAAIAGMELDMTEDVEPWIRSLSYSKRFQALQSRLAASSVALLTVSAAPRKCETDHRYVLLISSRQRTSIFEHLSGCDEVTTHMQLPLDDICMGSVLIMVLRGVETFGQVMDRTNGGLRIYVTEETFYDSTNRSDHQSRRLYRDRWSDLRKLSK